MTAISTDNGSLQVSEEVVPSNATNKDVIWSVVNGTGEAVINASGLLTALDNGTVTVKATASDGSEVYGTLVITMSNQIVPVTESMLQGPMVLLQLVPIMVRFNCLLKCYPLMQQIIPLHGLLQMRPVRLP